MQEDKKALRITAVIIAAESYDSVDPVGHDLNIAGDTPIEPLHGHSPQL